MRLLLFADENRWQTVIKTEGGPTTEFTLSYQSLLPSTSYTFRLIAYNAHGISYPVTSEDTVFTPSKLYLEYGFLQQSPFYRQTWFLVVIASVSVILIIALVAYLCVKTKSYKYKRKSFQIIPAVRFSKNPLELIHDLFIGVINSLQTSQSGV